MLVLQRIILSRGCWALRIGKNCSVIKKKKCTARNSFKCLSLLKSFLMLFLKEQRCMLALTTRWLRSLAHPAWASRLRRTAPPLAVTCLAGSAIPGDRNKTKFFRILVLCCNHQSCAASHSDHSRTCIHPHVVTARSTRRGACALPRHP